MQCISCGNYFRRDYWNNSDECEDCIDTLATTKYNYVDSTDEVEIETLVNPSGRTAPRFYD